MWYDYKRFMPTPSEWPLILRDCLSYSSDLNTPPCQMRPSSMASSGTEDADFVSEDFVSQPVYVISVAGMKDWLSCKTPSPMHSELSSCLELVACRALRRHRSGCALWRRFQLCCQSSANRLCAIMSVVLAPLMLRSLILSWLKKHLILQVWYPYNLYSDSRIKSRNGCVALYVLYSLYHCVETSIDPL
jgi:hypothetical protein